MDRSSRCESENMWVVCIVERIAEAVIKVVLRGNFKVTESLRVMTESSD